MTSNRRKGEAGNSVRGVHAGKTFPTIAPKMPSLLRAAWPQARVDQRYLQYATTLVAAGLEFRAIRGTDKSATEDLMNERLYFDRPYKMGNGSGGLLVTAEEEIIAGMVLDVQEGQEAEFAVRVTTVAVTPEWERRGVGTVLLGMIHQIVAVPKLIYGGCEPHAASFYQRAGFDVLREGELLPFTLGGGMLLAATNPHYPCWFVRYLR